jgi:hypothetical protein
MQRPLFVTGLMLRRALARGLGALVVVVAMSVGAVAPVQPARAAGTRYLDVTFTDVTVTRNVPYATAPNLITGAPQTLAVDIY